MKRVLTIAACALAGSACATGTFDRLYEAGRYDEALTVFAADSSLHASERSLFRAALAQATPGQAGYEPGRAQALLWELLRRFPAGEYHLQARALATSLARADSQQLSVEHEFAAMRARIATLEQRIALQEALHDELSAGTLALRDTLARVQTRLRVRESQLRALQEELRGLKQIDLGPIVPDTSVRR